MTFYDLTFIFYVAAKKLNFYGEKWDSDFGQKYEIHILVKKNDFYFQFFSRSLVK